MFGGENMEKDMVRINTRISSYANEWLDTRAQETGLSKSALVMLAVENYIQQTQAMQGMNDMTVLLTKLEQIEKRLSE